jgi:hypothetical protein
MPTFACADAERTLKLDDPHVRDDPFCIFSSGFDSFVSAAARIRDEVAIDCMTHTD